MENASARQGTPNTKRTKTVMKLLPVEPVTIAALAAMDQLPLTVMNVTFREMQKWSLRRKE